MPLLDHFHRPISVRLGWTSLHSGWATYLATNLSERWLPAPYLAAENTHRGTAIEVDVGAFDTSGGVAPAGGVATAPRVWTSRPPIIFEPAELGDTYEVLIHSDETGWKLVGAIELVSEANKDRPRQRNAFIGKCAGLLKEGVSVAVIDIVTNRHANLHNALLGLLGIGSGLLPEDSFIYASAYHPVERGGIRGVEVWAEVLEVGAELPTMPLRLSSELVVPVEFEATYTEICRLRRVI